MALMFLLNQISEQTEVTNGDLKSLAIVFEWIHMIHNTITLFILLISMFILQRSDLMISKVTKNHIAETSQHLIPNMMIIIMVIIYNICIFVSIFFITNDDLRNSHSTISKINITMSPFITCCIGAHLLGTLKWNKLHKYIRLFLIFSFFMSLLYYATFIIIHYPLFVALNDALTEFGGAMIRTLVVDGFAVFVIIMYYRAIEQIIQVTFFRHNSDSNDLNNEMLKKTKKKKVSTNNEESKIQTCHILLFVLLTTFFIIIDFFTVDKTRNVCKIGAAQFYCLYYMIAYFLLFYIIHIVCIYYILFKLFCVGEYHKKNIAFFWSDHISFTIALIGCLLNDICEFIQRVDDKWDNEQHDLTNGFILTEIFARSVFKISLFIFIIINKKYIINYTNMKWFKFYFKFIIITNVCLCIHYFLYEMKEEENIYEERRTEPPKYWVNIIIILISFLNIEFYLAAIERIDLYNKYDYDIDVEYEIDIYQPIQPLTILHSKNDKNEKEKVLLLQNECKSNENKQQLQLQLQQTQTQTQMEVKEEKKEELKIIESLKLKMQESEKISKQKIKHLQAENYRLTANIVEAEIDDIDDLLHDVEQRIQKVKSIPQQSITSIMDTDDKNDDDINNNNNNTCTDNITNDINNDMEKNTYDCTYNSERDTYEKKDTRNNNNKNNIEFDISTDCPRVVRFDIDGNWFNKKPRAVIGYNGKEFKRKVADFKWLNRMLMLNKSMDRFVPDYPEQIPEGLWPEGYLKKRKKELDVYLMECHSLPWIKKYKVYIDIFLEHDKQLWKQKRDEHDKDIMQRLKHQKSTYDIDTDINDNNDTIQNKGKTKR